MRVKAALIPDVAFVELPPKKSTPQLVADCVAKSFVLTVLVKKENVASGKIDGMRSAQARYCFRESDLMNEGILVLVGREYRTASSNYNYSRSHGIE